MAARLGPPRRWSAVAGGYTNAQRWVVDLGDGGSVFVKAAVDELTAGWLRAEQRVYAALRAPFLPEMLGFDDEHGLPLLVLDPDLAS